MQDPSLMEIRENDVVAVLGQVRSVDENTVTISIPQANGEQVTLVIEPRAARIIGREFLTGDEVYWKKEKHQIENELSKDLFTLKRIGALEGEASSYVIAKSGDLSHADQKSMFRFQSLAEAEGKSLSVQNQNENAASVTLLERTLESAPVQMTATRMSAASFSQDVPYEKNNIVVETIDEPVFDNEAPIYQETVAEEDENESRPQTDNRITVEMPEHQISEKEIEAPEQDEKPESKAEYIPEEKATEEIQHKEPQAEIKIEDEPEADITEDLEAQLEAETKQEPARQLPEESPIRQQTLENIKEAKKEEEQKGSALDMLD